MNIAKASSKIFGASTFNTVIGFLGIMFFSRELGASQMGVFFLFEAVVGAGSLVADFGLRGAVEKRISEGQPGGEVLSTALLLKLVPLATIAAFLVVFRETVNGYIGASVTPLLVLVLIFRELSETQQMVLSGEQRVGQMAMPDTARQLGWVGIGALFVLQGSGVTGLIYGLLAGYGAMYVWSWHRSATSLRRPSVKRGRSLLEFAKYNVVSSIQGYVHSWLDVAIIGFFLTTTAVGAYEVAWRVAGAIVTLSNAISDSLLPQISEWHRKGMTNQISGLVSDVSVPSLILVIPAFGGVLVLSREILTLIFGQQFELATFVLMIIAGEKIVHVLYGLFRRSLLAIDRPDLVARSILATLLTNLVLNLLLVHPLGIEGIAIATAVSFSLGAYLHWQYFTKHVPVEFPVRELGWCTASTLIMMMAIVVFKIVLSPVDTVLVLLVLIGTGALIYFGSLLLYTPLRTRLQNYGRSVIA